MSCINFNEISSLITKWLQNSSIESLQFTDGKLVEKAIGIVLYPHQDNEDSLFLQLCALNFLNAVIKTEAFKNKLSNDLIKSNAARLIKTVDVLKNDEISYYYSKEEYCLYIKLGSIVFSFHHVPLTTDVLKASFAPLIKWPGIRLQRIAQPLLNYALSMNNEIETTPMDINDVIIDEVVDSSSVNGFNSEKIFNNENNATEDNGIVSVSAQRKNVLTAIEKNTIKQRVLSTIDSYCSPDSEGWYALVEIAPKLKNNGIDYTEYGFKKLTLFLEAVFENSMQRRNEGTMVYLKFPLNNSQANSNSQCILKKVDNNQDCYDILSGVQVGDNVEINSFGNIKAGIISVLNKHFVQLELKGGRSIRIKCDSIDSIESAFLFNNLIDLSFANDIIKNVLLSEGLYTSSLIRTNATITMAESRRIWLVTDDGKNTSCSKVSLIGINKENLIKGQRVFAFPFKGEKAYCVLMEMTYYELFECFKKLISQKKDNSKDIQRAQIFSLLRFILENTNAPENQTKIKQLKKQLKSSISSPSLSLDSYADDDTSDTIASVITSTNNQEDDSAEVQAANNNIEEMIDKEPNKRKSETSNVEIYKPESTSLEGPKVIGYINLDEIRDPKKKNKNASEEEKTKDTVMVGSKSEMLPSMGKILRMGPMYGWISQNDQEDNLYFNTTELVSYAGIIEAPCVGDEVIFTLGQNARGSMAVCIHKQCARETIEELIEKTQRYDPKTCARLKKYIEDFDNLFTNTIETNENLTYYLNRIGVNIKMPFSPNDAEKLFAEKLSAEEYAKGINLLIDEVIKTDPSKSYNLFLRSFSYTKSHKMYDVSESLIKKALVVFEKQDGKTKYFKRLLKTINTLSNRIEITEKSIDNIINSIGQSSVHLPLYVKNAILNHKDFNGITPDQETIRTGLYKEEYIDEVKDYIKQNNANDLAYLTLIKLQLAFHTVGYNPMEDVLNFLLSRAKNILAIGDEKLYSEVRYLLRLYYRNRNFDTNLDYTVGLYLMTLGEYTPSDIEMYTSMRRVREVRAGYKLADLFKKAVESDVDNKLDLAMLSCSNPAIRQRILKEYESLGKNFDSIDEFPSLLKELNNRYIQYSTDPRINFMSFISYLQTSTILLNSEMNIIENDFDKIVSLVTDFNIGQKYTSILNAYKNIDQKIANITSKLSSNPTEIGYETLLPSLSLLKNNIYSKFVEIEQRVNPTITISILESVVLEDSQSSELKVEIRNSSDSARDVHINRLKAFGGDLTEANTVNIDVRLSADEEKTISIELHMCDRVFNENAAEVEFEIDYDDIFIATDQRVHETKIEGRTIRFNKETFTEIDNKFRHASGGEELEAGDSMFYGRESLIVNIQNAILNGSKNQIAIYGQKRSGKSSLLNQIIGRLESTENGSVICGKFSLQGLPDEESNPVNWILRNIAYSLLRGIRKSRIKNIDKSILELFKTESDAFTALREFIEYINTIVELQNSHFVILIDEFTYLYQLIKDGKVSEDFMRRWIALIETPDINLQTIVAAQDTLPHFMNESYASNYFNKFSKEPLSYLSREEAIQLIKDPIKNVVFLNHAEELIYEYTSGSAFFTQIFCTRLVDYLNFKKSRTVGKEEIETVANRLCTGTDRLEPSTFECLTKEADGSDFYESDNKRILKAIAEQTRAGGHVNMEDLDVDMPQEHIKEVLNNLYSRRVISKQGEDYSINVKLFVKWILNN